MRTPEAAAIRADAGMILRLGGPLLVNNLSVAGMGMADTVMGGQLGARSLAAIAVGFSYYGPFMIIGIGLTMALSPLVAHAYGRGDAGGVGGYLRQGAWVGLATAALLVAGLCLVRPALVSIGTDAQILDDAVGYVHAMAFGTPALVGFQLLRFVSEGLGRTRPMMVVAVLGLATNVAGNWVFMYGKLGMPALGAVGTGVATAIVSWVMFAAMLFWVARDRAYAPYGLLAGFEPPRPARLREILALGLPIAGSLLAEGGLFSAAGLLIGTLGATQIAAHQIALNYAAFMFMAPLSMHSATTVHTGHALGRGDAPAARRAGLVGIWLCGAMMAVSALGIVAGRFGIAALYTPDSAVRALAASLLLLAAAFQISDGLQVGAMGALRGFRDARVPLLICVLAYCGIGFPLAYWLGVKLGWGPAGVWWGLIAGLTACAVALNLRFRAISARAVRARGL